VHTGTDLGAARIATLIAAERRVGQMHLGELARKHPEKPAVVTVPGGATRTYAELDARSNQVAQLLWARGLRPGDHIAVLMENRPEYLEVLWAAQRSGLFWTPVNWHLTAAEVVYIVADCGASALFTSAAMGDVVQQVVRSGPEMILVAEVGSTSPLEDYDTLIAAQPRGPLASEIEGKAMFYSSGTTGRPKGIVSELDGSPFGTGMALDRIVAKEFGFDEESTYLCPAPLYHAAPAGWTMGTIRNGGTAVVMERFDPELTLRTIAERRITHAQFVPTMFVRLLKLPDAVRAQYDVSSLEMVVHAAAPCPAEVKDQMIDWLGPIVYEYYAGSEGCGLVALDSEQWLAHRGSVGRPLGCQVHIVGDDNREVPPGQVGSVYFESPVRFAYHGDPAKTAASYNDRGWATLGDLGYLDDDGYLYLVDRRTDLVISGGVNIYPQEVENVLVNHPAVADVAVLGVPDVEMGQAVRAVVELMPGQAGSPELADDLVAYCRDRLAHFKCPRAVDVVEQLPRLPNGKLLKHRLRQQYWPEDH